MQRDEESSASAPIEVTEIEVHEEPKPLLSLEELVTEAHAEAPRKRAQLTPGLRTARVVSVDGRVARVLFRGAREETIAAIAPETEREIIEDAVAQKESVLVEVGEDGQPFVVGVVQTRKPSEVHVTGEKIVVEGSREVLIRSGRAALRLREDGDVELVGSRISAASRGLFRIVGRILRLN